MNTNSLLNFSSILIVLLITILILLNYSHEKLISEISNKQKIIDSLTIELRLYQNKQVQNETTIELSDSSFYMKLN